MFSHHLGSGLFSSCRSSSHTCPMVLGFSLSLRRGSAIQRLSQNIAAMPMTTGMMMYQFQKPLVKSAMLLVSGQTRGRRVIVFQRQARGLVKSPLALCAPGPGDDADKQHEQHHCPNRMNEAEVHRRTLIAVPIPCR